MQFAQRTLGGVALAALLAGCSATDGFDYQIEVPDAVKAAAVHYQLSVFDGFTCTPFSLTNAQIDFARTATPSWRQRVDRADQLQGTLAASTFSAEAAFEVRALDPLEIPLAARCAPLSHDFASAGFSLAQLAPTMAMVSVTTTVALYSGGARQNIEVKVLDANGMVGAIPVPVSIGAAYPLTTTDTISGIARIQTPTTAAGLDVALKLEVYGVPGKIWNGHASVLKPPVCPSASWTSDPLWPAGSGSMALVAAGGWVLVLRPDGADGSGRALDVMAPVTGRAQLMRVATATVPADVSGPIAAIATSQAVVVALSASGASIVALSMNTLSRRFSASTRLLIAGPSSGGADLIDALILDPLSDQQRIDLIASASAHTPAIQRFTGTATPGAFLATPAPALDAGEDLAARDLLLAPVGGDPGRALVVSALGQLKIYAEAADGGFHAPARVLSGVSGKIAVASLAPLIEAGPDLLLADPSSGGTPDAEDQIFAVRVAPASLSLLYHGASGRGASASVVADQNGDQRPDLLVLNADAATLALFVGDARGSFVRATTCPVSGGPSGMIPFDLDGDGRPEAILAVPDQRAVSVFTLAR